MSAYLKLFPLKLRDRSGLEKLFSSWEKGVCLKCIMRAGSLKAVQVWQTQQWVLHSAGWDQEHSTAPLPHLIIQKSTWDLWQDPMGVEGPRKGGSPSTTTSPMLCPFQHIGISAGKAKGQHGWKRHPWFNLNTNIKNIEGGGRDRLLMRSIETWHECIRIKVGKNNHWASLRGHND